jgi:hypothetical protein
MYIILRGRWRDIIVLNFRVPAEDKTDDVKDLFYEKLKHLIAKFPRKFDRKFQYQRR